MRSLPVSVHPIHSVTRHPTTLHADTGGRCIRLDAVCTPAYAESMNATVKRHRAPSDNRDADYFQAVCSECGWKDPAMYSNRTVEGRTLAERNAKEHDRARHSDG